MALTPAREIAANRPARMGAKLSFLTRWRDLPDQRCPLLPRGGQAAAERLVELALPHPGRLVSLHGTGGALIVWTDAHRGPPYLDVFDEAGRWLA